MAESLAEFAFQTFGNVPLASEGLKSHSALSVDGCQISRKRKIGLSSQDQTKPPKRYVSRPYKNPVEQFHELYPGVTLVFSYIEQGPVHQPTFIAKTTVNEVTYEGSGGSKAKAKADLARRALHLLGFATPSEADEAGPSLNLVKPEVDWPGLDVSTSSSLLSPSTGNIGFFSSNDYFEYSHFDNSIPMPGRDRDRPLYAPPGFRGPPPRPYVRGPPCLPGPGIHLAAANHSAHAIRNPRPLSPPQAVAQKFSQYFTNRPPIDYEKARLYPVMVLVELFPEMKVEWVDGVGRGDRQFRVETEILSRRFFGEGRSKKLAKLNLAKTVLLCMYDIHDFKDADTLGKTTKSKVEGVEVAFEKKFPLTQLKELVAEDIQYDIKQVEGDVNDDEKMFVCTAVIRGVVYETVGKSKNLAKLRCAKKALEVLKPKKEGKLLICSESADNGSGDKSIDTSRHPSMVFHELFRDVRISESETKGVNLQPEYHMEAEIDGQIFEAKANAKKKAKLRLVLAALEQLKNIPPESWTGIDMKDLYEDKQPSSNPATNHPIVLLLKLNPNTHFSVTEDYECDAAEKYRAVAFVGEREFTGVGPNKKAAKTIAARLSLHALYGINPDTYVEESRNDYFESSEPKQELDVDLCNSILAAVQEKCSSLFQGEMQCKVIAAFVLVTTGYDGNSLPSLDVISIGTGTKCITGDQMDHKGQTLNDCHGEVIACRGFRMFLFNQLHALLQGDENTVLRRKRNGRLGLRENVALYLYVNTAPCGDGRVFTLQSVQQGAKNKTAGLLRTKIENGQGTIPVPENSVQTSDGILEGERLRTMSCSDKILKWNAIGVQGALLSYLLDPIYLQGIVVGLHYNYEVLYRALYKRAGKLCECPDLYGLHLPALGSPSQTDNRDTSKATSNSFNWFRNEKTVEAVNSTTGKTVIMSASRLCKLNFFDMFMKMLKEGCINSAAPTTYHDAKLLAKDYQLAKEKFFLALDQTTCGKWIGKPYEHDMFGY